MQLLTSAILRHIAATEEIQPRLVMKRELSESKNLSRKNRKLIGRKSALQGLNSFPRGVLTVQAGAALLRVSTSFVVYLIEEGTLLALDLSSRDASRH